MQFNLFLRVFPVDLLYNVIENGWLILSRIDEKDRPVILSTYSLCWSRCQKTETKVRKQLKRLTLKADYDSGLYLKGQFVF